MPVGRARVSSSPPASRSAYVRLADFSDGAGDELSQVVKQRLKGGAKAVVLDLRDNGGGLLNEAVKAASVFIPEGTIVTTDGRTRPRHVFKATGDAISTKIPVVVLVDRGHGVGGRDRDRRARRTATAPRSSARTPSARASSRRSSRSTTAARSTSRSASTSPQRAQPRRRRDQARRRHHSERGRAPAAAQPRGQDARDGPRAPRPRGPQRRVTQPRRAEATYLVGVLERRGRRSRRRRSSSAGAPSRSTATSARTPATSSWCGPLAAAAARSCAGSAAPTSRAT